MTQERNSFEINSSNATLSDNELLVTIPYFAQSMEGLDLYFDPDFIGERELIATEATIEADSEIKRFYNWLLTAAGTISATESDELGVDIGITSPALGVFGFSGFAEDEGNITIRFTLK